MNAFTAMPAAELVFEPSPLAARTNAAPDLIGDPCAGVFGPLEWLVIAIGQRDGTASFRSRPLLDAIGRLFASRPPNPLANSRLEELRRMAALADERGWHLPPSEVAAFLRAGWTEEQLEVLVDKVRP